MDPRKLTVKAEIANREWLQFEIEVGSEGVVKDVVWHGFGCQPVLETGKTLAIKIRGAMIDQVTWGESAVLGQNHWDFLAREIVARLQERFANPLSDPELCHCRKIPNKKVDEAIILGAHTPEKVRTWTQASSGCGTCRPDIETMIEFRLKKV